MESNIQKIIDEIEINEKKKSERENQSKGCGLFTVVYTVFAILVNVGVIARPANGFTAWVWDCLKGWSCIPFYFLAVLAYAFVVVVLCCIVLGWLATLIKD